MKTTTLTTYHEVIPVPLHDGSTSRNSIRTSILRLTTTLTRDKKNHIFDYNYSLFDDIIITKLRITKTP